MISSTAENRRHRINFRLFLSTFPCNAKHSISFIAYYMAKKISCHFVIIGNNSLLLLFLLLFRWLHCSCRIFVESLGIFSKGCDWFIDHEFSILFGKEKRSILFPSKWIIRKVGECDMKYDNSIERQSWLLFRRKFMASKVNNRITVYSVFYRRSGFRNPASNRIHCSVLTV